MAHCYRDLSRAAALLGWLLACAAPMPSAHAQPSVRVRANTQIALQTTRGERGLELTGTLLDDLGAPLPSHALELVIESASARQKQALKTSKDGTFHASFASLGGHYRVLVKFSGDTAYSAAEQMRDVDLSQVEIRLHFVEPRALRVDLDADTQRVWLRAESALGGAAIDVGLEDERGRELARGRTDENSAFRVDLPAQTLGEPGLGRIVATTAGDTQRAAARAELEILRFRKTRLSLQVSADTEREDVVFAGKLSDSQHGIANKAIGLFDGDRHLATVRSSRDGTFRHAMERSALQRAALQDERATTLRVQARFDADAPWLGSSRSEIAALHISADAALSPLWLLGPLALCGVALWLLSRRDLQARHELRDAVTQRGPGFHPTRRGPADVPERARISGEVRDASSHRALEASSVTLEASGQRIELLSDKRGQFASGELAPGTWQLSVRANGYAALTSNVVVPHRGEWSDVQVLLASLRSAAVDAYRPAAARALPSLELWESWTARETLDNARRNGHAPESFIQLTDRVERAAYAKDSPNADDIAAIERTALTAIAEMPDVSEQSDQSQSRNSSALLRARIPHHR